jgi:hypothetical protein
MKPFLTVCVILGGFAATTMLGGCDLDKARGSGATKHHADRNQHKDDDDKAWDEATAPLTCETATWPTDPVCPGGTAPSRCSIYNGSPVWAC